MKNSQISATTEGIVIAVLIFFLVCSCIAIYWEAQVIAEQQAAIQYLLEGQR